MLSIGRIGLNFSGLFAATFAVVVSLTLPALAQLPDIRSLESYGNWAYQVLAQPPTGIGFMANAEADILAQTNQTRAQSGLTSVIGSAQLQAVARVHAIDMLERGFFNHVNPEGRGPADRVGILDRSFIGTTGENIASKSGFFERDEAGLARQFHNNWMGSEGHRQNILRGNWTALGVGVAYRDGAVVAVQVFGNEKARLEQPAPISVRRGEGLDLRARGGNATPQLFDLWDPVRMRTVGRPMQIGSGLIDGALAVAAGTYSVRFYFAEGAGRFQIFTGPRLIVR